MRTTLLGLRLGRALGVTGESLSAAYYVSLLRFIGCSAYAHETARTFPDDNAMRGAAGVRSLVEELIVRMAICGRSVSAAVAPSARTAAITAWT